jgi:hypothetical protein
MRGEFLPVVNALETNIDGALARIRELEAQLAEAEKWRLKGVEEINRQRVYIEALEHDVEYFKNAKEQAEARAEAMRAALKQVEAWFTSDDGPLFRLWENCELGEWEYEDGGQKTWEATLHLVRDSTIPAASLGCIYPYPEVRLYRQVRAALAPATPQLSAEAEEREENNAT